MAPLDEDNDHEQTFFTGDVIDLSKFPPGTQLHIEAIGAGFVRIRVIQPAEWAARSVA